MSSFLLVFGVVLTIIIYKYFGKYKKFVLMLTIPVILFIKLAEELLENELSAFDNEIYSFLKRVISDRLTGIMTFLSYLGSAAFLILVTLCCLFIFVRKKKLSFYAKMIPVNLLISALFNEVFKRIFHRTRPDINRLVQITGFSFPSGHSTVSMSFYGYLAYLIFKNVKSRLRYLYAILLILLVLMIGISRIYLGVHYASDVIAGFCEGASWLIILIQLIKIIEPDESNEIIDLK